MRAGYILMLGVSVLTLGSCKATSMRDDTVSSAIPVHTYGATAGNGSLGFHTVHRGETVWTISQRYGLVLRDILDANHLQPPYNLSSGERLTLPAPQTYKVRDGDSLYTVSRLFNTSTTDLARLNNLAPPYKMSAGQTLKLPPKYEAPAVQQVAFRPAYTPPPATIDTEALPPVAGQAAPANSSGGYVPPPSSPSDYQDDLPPQAKAQQASAQSAAKAVGAPPAREGKFIKPVAGKIISSYGLKKDGLHNDGVNIQAAKGDAVRAAESGVIVYTGSQIEGYGNLILIRHADQYVTAYAHLDKTLVKKGDKVKRGQTVGTVGATGSVDKPQLHFEIRKGTKALDPSGLVNL